MNEGELFIAVLQIQNPADRSAYLEQACSGDVALRERVEALLKASAQAGSFLQQPATPLGVTIAEPIHEAPGTVIGPYKLLEQIGEGGFGVVFMAEQTQPVRRKVALKVLKPGMDTRQVVARFEAERQALAIMDHPNIARVFDGGATASGRPYFVMELVKGVPITEHCDQNHLTPRERLELFVSVCHAVQHAHQKGIIHRDLKPSNVLVTMHDVTPVVKVIDFGVAKALGQELTDKTLFTAFAQLIGTPLYMSPEQAGQSALDIDTRSDIYSLGVLLYELLTGTTPFHRDRFRQAAYDEIRRIIIEEEPPKPSTRLSELGKSSPHAPRAESGARSVPTTVQCSLASIAAQRHTDPVKLPKLVRGELDWIVMKCLEKDRNRRYETANGMAMDIQRYLSDEAVTACPPSAGYRLRKFARRNRVAISSASLVAAALVLGTVISVWQAVRATQARNDAEVARTEEATQRAAADERRVEADEQRSKAEVARKQAIASLQKAREAGEQFFTIVSESRLLDEAGLQPLREELIKAAVAYYESLATRNSNDPTLQSDVALNRLRLAQIRHQTGDNDRAIATLAEGLELIEQLMREHPDASDEHLKLAGFWHGGRWITGGLKISDIDRAVQVYQKAAVIWESLVERYPTATGFRSDLSKFYDLQGQLLLSMGKPDEALRTQQKVLEIREQIVRDDPDVYEHLAELAQSYHSLAFSLERSDSDKAEAFHRKAIALQKNAPDVMTYQEFLAQHQRFFGAFLVRRKKPDQAIQVLQDSLANYEKLAKQYPPRAQLGFAIEHVGNTYRNLAILLANMGRIEEADQARRQVAEIFGKLADEFPKNANYRIGRGHAHAELGLWSKAAADYAKGTELSADNALNWYHLALTRIGAGDLAGYRTTNRDMLKRFGDTKDPNQAHWLAWACVLAPDAVTVWDQIVHIAERAVQADLKSDSYLNTLGCILYRAGRFEKAAEQLAEVNTRWEKAAVKPTMFSPAYTWFFLAMTHHRLEHAEEARQWLEKAVNWTKKETENKIEGTEPLSWNGRLTLELLRREAEQLIGVKKDE